MNNKKRLFGVLALVVVLLFTLSCVAGVNQMSDVANSEGEVAGFFSGLWHGFILLFSFIISLFNKDISVYEIHNSGPLYNLGFLIGVSAFFSGSGHAGKRKRKNRC